MTDKAIEAAAIALCNARINSISACACTPGNVICDKYVAVARAAIAAYEAALWRPIEEARQAVETAAKEPNP